MFFRSPKLLACNWPRIPTTHPCQLCVDSRAWFTSLVFTNVSSTSTPVPVTSFEFCLGTLGEMTGDDFYAAVESYSRQQRLGYVHFRNVAGRVPQYRETFIDDGEIDMIHVLSILHRNGFDGVLIPDHTPQITCDAPWHAGMAHTLGFMRAALMSIERASAPQPGSGK